MYFSKEILKYIFIKNRHFLKINSPHVLFKKYGTEFSCFLIINLIYNNNNVNKFIIN